MDFEERINKWAEGNGYRYNGIENEEVQLSRISDGYPFSIKKTLIEQIMQDEGM
ncbi:hypothetical protein [Lysinibacillus odysseyi]|uniref:hypothetical protein n=1 Tax=Lysinibacillus odysseyi TaxID=202611 RepID=UPI000A4F1DC5|nr:hypothetical protein [Lysinibacillus odysseyi]